MVAIPSNHREFGCWDLILTPTASNGSTSTATRPTGSHRTTTGSLRSNRFTWRNGDRCPTGRPMTAPTGGRSGGRGCRSAKRRAELRHTGEGERRDDFDIRQEWWTGDALPEAKVVRRELAGVPKVEVVGLSKEKVEELFWDTITQVRADLAGIQRK